jgi:hypothetical protein
VWIYLDTASSRVITHSFAPAVVPAHAGEVVRKTDGVAGGGPKTEKALPLHADITATSQNPTRCERHAVEAGATSQ